MIKIVIFTLVLAISLIGISTIASSSSENYIKIIEPTSSFTKAICTEKNFCQDYEVFCKEEEIIRMSPITGAAVQFSPQWEDPRSEEFINKFC